MATSLLSEKIYESDIDGLKILLAENADSVNKKTVGGEETLAHVSCKMGNCDALKLLVEAGADLVAEDSRGRFALAVAIEKKHFACVDYLLSHLEKNKPKWIGNLLSTADRQGSKPIHFACRDADILARVLNASSDPLARLGLGEVQQSTGLYPIHLSSLCGNAQCCSLLLKYGIDANVKNKTGESAVILAAKEGYTEVVKVLAQHGADLTAANGDMDTALHFACMLGHDDLADFLIGQNGVNIAAKNSEGKTALDYRNVDAPPALGPTVGPNDEEEDSLVSVVRGLNLVENVVRVDAPPPATMEAGLKITPKAYLEKHVLPDLQPALVALLKRHEKNEKKRSGGYEPVPVDPCHWIASYLQRHKQAPLEPSTPRTFVTDGLLPPVADEGSVGSKNV